MYWESKQGWLLNFELILNSRMNHADIVERFVLRWMKRIWLVSSENSCWPRETDGVVHTTQIIHTRDQMGSSCQARNSRETEREMTCPQRGEMNKGRIMKGGITRVCPSWAAWLFFFFLAPVKNWINIVDVCCFGVCSAAHPQNYY